MARITVYEKRSCSTCRKLRELLDAREVEYETVQYLDAGLTALQLREMLDQARISAREALRTREALVAELGLDDPDVGGTTILERMAEHPQLLQRPFVVVGDRAVLARPVERVLELLET